MKGDFSRWTFDPRRHYTAVLMQQGRVQLDSDWNEQAALLEHLDRTRFGDVVGSSGVPRGVGFEVYVGADGAPMLTAGRIYAGGLICELDADTPISHVARTPLRQWNQTAGPTVTVEPNSIALEDGIRVCFGGSGFRRGDYWTFPARVASPTVEWPSEAPPQGVEHGLCPLALVTSGRSGSGVTTADAPSRR